MNCFDLLLEVNGAAVYALVQAITCLSPTSDAELPPVPPAGRSV